LRGGASRPKFDVMQQRVALVSGANRGIGLEIARQLAAAGLHVVGTSRDEADGQALKAKLGVDDRRLDVADPSSIAALARSLSGGLDVLVNNAGISLHGFDVEVAKKTLDINFFGAMRVTDELLPLMRPGGRIVMVSSGMGELSSVSPALGARFSDPSLERAELVELMRSFVRDVAEGTHAARGWPSSAYRVSKVGLNALTRILARELAGDPRRILVNAVCPGWVRTGMGGPSAPRSAEQGAKTPVWAALLPDGGPTGGFFRDERPIAW
jgi:NAD(P)-dependent dehydrogenase (short-subunit alcohol dehydrogenase family)